MSQQQTQTVWVAKCYRRATDKYYHTNEDCRLLNKSDQIKEKQLNVLTDNINECEVCKNSEQSHGIQQDKDCPFCGETVGKLPSHFPCEQS